MKNVLARLRAITIGTLLKRVPYYIFVAMLVNLLLVIVIDIFKRQFTEADGVRIVAAIWVFITMLYWLYAQQIEKLYRDSEVLLAFKSAEVGQKLMEIAALERTNDHLLEVLGDIDKDILHRHGIHVTLRKKKVIN